MASGSLCSTGFGFDEHAVAPRISNAVIGNPSRMTIIHPLNNSKHYFTFASPRSMHSNTRGQSDSFITGSGGSIRR